jgi:hypothetical protein
VILLFLFSLNYVNPLAKMFPKRRYRLKSTQKEEAEDDVVGAAWAQLEQHQESRKETHLQVLVRAYTVASTFNLTEPGLQHTCSRDCDFVALPETDWFLCKSSGNRHVCTTQECKFRSDSNSVGVRIPKMQLNKEDKTQETTLWLHQPDRESTCTLTSFVRETTDMVPEMPAVKRPVSKANEKKAEQRGAEHDQVVRQVGLFLVPLKKKDAATAGFLAFHAFGMQLPAANLLASWRFFAWQCSSNSTRAGIFRTPKQL